jgi:FG-GAP repeat/Putative metal-binding motif
VSPAAGRPALLALLLAGCLRAPNDTQDTQVEDECDEPTTWYNDADSDGYGDAAEAVEACEAPSGALATAGDCDDSDPAVHPDAEERCNGAVDDDCDGDAADCGWFGEVSTDVADVRFIGTGPATSVGSAVVLAELEAGGGWTAVLGSPQDLAVRGFVEPFQATERFDEWSWSVADLESNHGFGTDVAAASVDGVPIVWVGSPGHGGGMEAKGAAFAFEVSAGADLDTSFASASLDASIAFRYFGTEVELLPDFDGDGGPDLAAGAPGSSFADIDCAVAVVDFDLQGEVAVAKAERLWWGPPNGCATLRQGGDIDGDGLDDLLVGGAAVSDTDTNEGSAWLVLGGEPGGSLDDATSVFAGEKQWAELGAALTGLGDVNLDGYDDFAIGIGTYQIAILLGASEPPDDINDAAARIDGVDKYQSLFGARIAGVGDTDGDGLGELAVTLPYENTIAGAVWLYSPPYNGVIDAEAALVRFEGTADNGQFGLQMTAADVDGDGAQDLLVGAPYENLSGKKYATEGAAYLFLGG